jgi:prepilin-type N-terminal cleavage/methylation domain-containing protein
MHSFQSRNASRQSGGFTLVELLVVIGIIAILAGVALGPITNGIRKGKESAAMQTTRTLALAEFQYANDNSQQYPDGTDAGVIAQDLVSGNYTSDPGIFIISGDSSATKVAGGTTMTAANVSYDFTGVTGTGANVTPGVGSSAPDQLPLVWTPDTHITGIPTTADSGVQFAPSNPLFGKDGVAVAYHSNNAFFRAPVANPTSGAFPSTAGDALFIDNTFDPNSVVYSIRHGASGY